MTKIRQMLNDANNGVFGKITVVRRGANIVCREDIGTPRNSNLKMDMFDSFVKRTLNVETRTNIYQGRKGIYSNWWCESIILKENANV